MIVKWNTDVDEPVLVTYPEPTTTIPKYSPSSFFQRVFQFFKSAIVEDVPPELDACETCRELNCPQHRFEHCERRLERYRMRMKNRS